MGDSSNFAQPSIPKFDGDYDHWSMLMENLLRSKEYFGVVKDGVAEPANEEALSDVQKKSLAEARLKDLKAKNYLFSAIDKSILKTITLKETSKQLWDSMKTKYQGNARVKRAQLQSLRRSFELLEMKNGESVTDYFTRVMVVANDMRNCGDDMQDVKIVEKILRTLTENFNYIVCSIEESKDIDSLSVDSLQSSLLVHEQKMRKSSIGAEEQLLKVSYEERGGRGRGRGSGRGRGRGRFNKATVECYKCHKLGHFQYECQEGNKANYAEADEYEGDVLLMAFSTIKEEKEEAWYLDSGCSNHMCGDKGWFSMLDESFKCSVKLGNNSMLSVVGKGNVNMSVNGRSHIISDVYLVPELTSNLVSLGQLVQKGCEILFQNNTCKIYHSEFGLIMQSQMTENKLFKIMATRKVITSRDVVFEEEKLVWEESESEINEEELNQDPPLAQEVVERREETEMPRREETSATRTRRPPLYLRDYETGEDLSGEEEEDTIDFVMFASLADPVTFEEAKREDKWIKAMDTELESIEKNGTWVLTELPKGTKKIGVKWIYKTKLNEKGEVDKNKARLVAKGYAQQQDVDYNEVFAPVARWDTIRMILALAAQEDWCIYQLDVKSAFLYGEISENVYVEQPLGYIKKGEEHKVYKLKKALYGLKQAPRAWYSKIEAYFSKEGFQRCEYEHTLFVKTNEGNKILIVSLYVDDLICTGNDEMLLERFISSMKKEFDMTDLGKMEYFLGVEVVQDTGIFIHQKKYAGEILERFNLLNGNEVKNPIVPGTKLTKEGNGNKVDSTLYKQLIGSLMYITSIRPDLMYVVCLLSRYMADPYDEHMKAAKRVLRYLKGTLGFGVFYKRKEVGELTVYTDSDYAGDTDDRRSTSGYAFLLSGGAVAWASKKQPVVTLSTTEAEFVSAAYCACQCIWMRRILEEFGLKQLGSTTILCDNSSAIKLSKNPVLMGEANISM